MSLLRPTTAGLEYDGHLALRYNPETPEWARNRARMQLEYLIEDSVTLDHWRKAVETLRELLICYLDDFRPETPEQETAHEALRKDFEAFERAVDGKYSSIDKRIT